MSLGTFLLRVTRETGQEKGGPFLPVFANLHTEAWTLASFSYLPNAHVTRIHEFS